MIFNIYLGIFPQTSFHLNLVIIFKYLTNKHQQNRIRGIPSGYLKHIDWHFLKHNLSSCDSSLPRSPPPYVHPKDHKDDHGCDCHYTSQEVRILYKRNGFIVIPTFTFINVLMSLETNDWQKFLQRFFIMFLWQPLVPV